MIVVSDTTPLHYLILIEATHVLAGLFGRVYAPSVVMAELSHPNASDAVKAWAGNPPEWLTVQDPKQVDPSLKLDAGETAAISLALELEADYVLMDERKGVKETLSRGFRAVSTLTILEEAASAGLLDYAEKRDRLVSETNFHVSESVLRESEERYRVREQRRSKGPEGGRE